jgi:hypothetical protein
VLFCASPYTCDWHTVWISAGFEVAISPYDNLRVVAKRGTKSYKCGDWMRQQRHASKCCCFALTGGGR